jgi:hypothetical protein
LAAEQTCQDYQGEWPKVPSKLLTLGNLDCDGQEKPEKKTPAKARLEGLPGTQEGNRLGRILKILKTFQLFVRNHRLCGGGLFNGYQVASKVSNFAEAHGLFGSCIQDAMYLRRIPLFNSGYDTIGTAMHIH